MGLGDVQEFIHLLIHKGCVPLDPTVLKLSLAKEDRDWLILSFLFRVDVSLVDLRRHWIYVVMWVQGEDIGRVSKDQGFAIRGWKDK